MTRIASSRRSRRRSPMSDRRVPSRRSRRRSRDERLARAADRHRDARAGRAGGDGLPAIRLADDGPAHAGFRAGARPPCGLAARGRRLERHRRAAPRLPGRRDRPGRRGDRARVHVRGERRAPFATWAPSRCFATCAAHATSTSTPRMRRGGSRRARARSSRCTSAGIRPTWQRCGRCATSTACC